MLRAGFINSFKPTSYISVRSLIIPRRVVSTRIASNIPEESESNTPSSAQLIRDALFRNISTPAQGVRDAYRRRTNFSIEYLEKSLEKIRAARESELQKAVPRLDKIDEKIMTFKHFLHEAGGASPNDQPPLASAHRLSPSYMSTKELEKLRLVIHQQLLTTPYRIFPCSSLDRFKAALSNYGFSNVSMLRVLNAINSRMQRLGLKPSKSVATEALRLSVDVGSASAVKRYLHLLDSYPRGLNMDSRNTLGYTNALKLSEEFSKGPKNLRHTRELLQVVTGWRNNGVGQAGETRAPSLYTVIDKNRVNGWRRYLRALQHPSMSSVIRHEWIHFQETRAHTERSLGPGAPKQIVNLFARVFVRVGDPERAWEILHECGYQAEDVEPHTWELLLGHVDCIKGRFSGMAELLMSEYQRRLEDIEASMGIRWDGGEDGSHMSYAQKI